MVEWSPMGGRLAEDRPSRCGHVAHARAGGAHCDARRKTNLPACLYTIRSHQYAAYCSSTRTSLSSYSTLIPPSPGPRVRCSSGHLQLGLEGLRRHVHININTRVHQIICHTQQGAKCGWRTPKCRANMSIIIPFQRALKTSSAAAASQSSQISVTPRSSEPESSDPAPAPTSLRGRRCGIAGDSGTCCACSDEGGATFDGVPIGDASSPGEAASSSLAFIISGG